MARRLVGTSLEFPGAFALRDEEGAEPGPGQVRVRIKATALGFVDGLLVQGRYQIKPSLPYVPGGEIAGIIDAVGHDVAGLAVGDHVATWQLSGGLADSVIVDGVDVDLVDPDLSLTVVAAMLVDFQTARYALFDRGHLKAGETVLVLGASGGVASAAIQLAKQAGAYIIAAASNAEKRDVALALGADVAIDYCVDGWRDALRAAAPVGTVDVIVDPVGGEAFQQAFRSLAKGGRHLVIGFAEGVVPSLPANLPLLKSASLVGVDIRHFIAAQAEAARLARQSLFGMMKDGRLAPPRMTTFPLEQAMEAISWTMRRDKQGKIVVLP